MNPKPFASLNHLTVPLLIFTSSFRLPGANPDPGDGSRRSRKGIDCHCDAPHGARRGSAETSLLDDPARALYRVSASISHSICHRYILGRMSCPERGD